MSSSTPPREVSIGIIMLSCYDSSALLFHCSLNFLTISSQLFHIAILYYLFFVWPLPLLSKKSRVSSAFAQLSAAFAICPLCLAS